MKRRITAFLLSAVLCLSLVGTAFAAEEDTPSAAGPTAEWVAEPDANTATIVVKGLSKNQNYALTTLQLKPAGADAFNADMWIYPYFTSDANGNVTLEFSDIVKLSEGDTLRLAIPNGSASGKNFVDDYVVVKKSTPETVTITFDPAGGTMPTNAINPLTLDKGAAIGTLPVPTRSGYRFLGWYKADGTPVSETTAFDADATLTARWQKIEDSKPGDDRPNGGGSSGGSSSTTQRISVKKTTGGTVTCRPGSPSKGTTVTVTVHPNAGYVLDELRVYDRNGKLIDVTKVSDTEYTFVMPEGAVTVEPIFKLINANTGTFSDVPSSHTFYSDISWVASKGYMGGYGDGTFRPSANTTRQALWMVLARIDGANPADMTAARSWATRNNISDGTNPGGAMSRQQMVTMLYRYAQMKGYATTGGTSLDGFKDAAAVADYAKDAMSWAVGNGIVQGNNNSLLPTGTATRAHFAAFLHRFCTTVGIA